MKNWQKINPQNKGFSLIELLVVAAIIGVLVTLAVPRYKSAVARSRQAEATGNLGTIRKLQEGYWMYKASIDGTGDFYAGGLTGAKQCADSDGAKNPLGFRLSDCSKSRYLYTAVKAAPTAVSGSGDDVYPDCGSADAWSINQSTGDLDNSTDVVSVCDD